MNIRSLICTVVLISVSLFGAYFKDLETTVYQPDGTKLNIFSSGDEFYNYLHNAEGYKIIQGADRYFYYADMENGKFVPTSFKAGKVEPKNINSLDKNINISAEEYRRRVEKFNGKADKGIKAPSVGSMNNITIYIKFSDQDEFEQPRSVFDQRFNGTGTGIESLKNYFLETSYNKFTISTTHYPVCADSVSLSYTAPHPRSYYMPYDAILNPDGYTDQAEREHELLKDAIESVASQIPTSINLDVDRDDYVDNICFIIRGPHTAWAELLWAHKWALYSYNVMINDKYVWTYTLQPENQNTVRTLSHEMFHAVGAPDLYHYNFDGMTPAGPWDIMESGFGHMSAYMKRYYGNWISSIPQISTSGQYTLNPLTSSTNNCYMIKPDSGSNDSYVIEYRKRIDNTFEKYIPGSGLVVYKVNELYQYQGNADGPPDELFVFREGGSLTTNGNTCNAFLSADVERTEINDFTDPAAYNSSGNESGLNIYNISSSGETISFYVDLSGTQYPPLCKFSQFKNGDYVPYGSVSFGADASALSGDLDKVEFYVNGELAFSDDTAPYTYDKNFGLTDLGQYKIKATAYSGGLTSSDEINVKIYDQDVPNWFYYYSDEPYYNIFNRGTIELRIAAVYDLGTTEFYANKISVNLEQDPYGFNDVPGEFDCAIYRFQDGQITSELLADLGTHISPMEGRFEKTVTSYDKISGQIALVMNIGYYQYIKYDMNGIPDNYYIIETGRPWTGVVARGVTGALDMAVMLSKHPTSIEDNVTPSETELYQNYPNPFNPETTIKYSLSNDAQVKLTVFDIAGREVSSLVDMKQNKGVHEAKLMGNDLTSGIYFYKLSVDGTTVQSKKMIILK
ncbi:MAG TPA: M6 family metalloprotease domain-containing protein [Clostridiales bacterium]|nr:M6 family metalloprotease domain-containing protein [Clostridiales bacterium]HQP69858.1 M6 family metalloprotease domain-containing protein [Clostridiales bacterium]